MATISKTRLSIRFFGDDLDPHEITARLGRAPSEGASKGGVIVSENGTERIARTGSWRLLAGHRMPGDLDGQVAELIETLNDDLSVWQDLSARFRGDVFCGLFMQESNEGIGLSAATMESLSSRGLAIGFDIYDPDRPD